MSQQDSDETPIAFHDVAAYFSEVEWKLLHQWQKELYTNVMKEIHQALISLGYQIINPDILLRINKGEEAYTPDLEDPERRECIDDGTSSWYPTVHPDIVFRIKQEEEEELSLRQGCDAEKTDMVSSSHNKGIVTTSVCSLSTDEEERMSPMDQTDSKRIYSNSSLSSDKISNSDLLIGIQQEEDHQNTEGRKSNDSISTVSSGLTGFSLPKTDISLRPEEESGVSLMDHYRSEGGQILTSPSSFLQIITTVVPFSLKEEMESYPMDYQYSESREPISSLAAGNGTINLKKEDEESGKCLKTTPPFKISSGNIKVELLQGSEKETNYRKEVCTESNPGLGGGNSPRCEGGFTNSAHSVLYLVNPTLMGSDSCDAYVDDLRDAALLTGPQNTEERVRAYQCNVCGMRFSRKVHLITHQITHTGETGDTPYQCTECETSFSQKMHLIAHQRTHLIAHQRTHLIAHQRTHTRLYKCSQCEKSYSCNGNLIRHKKTHSGDRPFHCTECEQTYAEKGSLTRHYKSHVFSLKENAIKRQRTQTGVRLEQCTKYEKSFTQKEDRLKPQTHTEQKFPYQCTECEKSFDRAHKLSRHKMAHTEERPYHCTECNQRFKQRGGLNRHKRSHTGEKPFHCPECGKSFTQNHALTRHQQKTHAARDENMEAMVGVSRPKGQETVRWTIEGDNELVSVSSNVGSTVA